MAKKPRSQRRKKGNSLGEDNDAGNTNLAVADVDLLSDSFTVADSISTAALEEEYLHGGTNEYDSDGYD